MANKQKTIVFKASDNVKNKMIEYYKYQRKDKTPPYAVFQAMEADTTITLYESGKVMFQGISADIDAGIWAALEKKVNNKDVLSENSKKEKKEVKKEYDNSYLKKISTVGSDEVGTGDYFGPIIVTAAYVSKENITLMQELKIGDSKKITDDKIIELAKVLIEKIPYTTFCLSNEEYNAIENSNMNKVKAVLHNKALIGLIEKEKLNPEKIVIDQFTTPKSYYGYLTGLPKVLKDILFLTKAEDQVYSVAAASIISRYLFLIKMHEMGKVLGNTVPLGAGLIVDEFAKKLVKEKGPEVLKKYTKYNFKNTDKVLN